MVAPLTRAIITRESLLFTSPVRGISVMGDWLIVEEILLILEHCLVIKSQFVCDFWVLGTKICVNPTKIDKW